MCAHSCLTLCNPMDCNPLGSSLCGILQERILVWVAIPFSKGSSWPRDQILVSCTGSWILNHWATWEAPLLVLVMGNWDWSMDEATWSESRSVVSDSLWPHVPYSTWNSLGQNTGVGSLSFLQGIFPTQGWNPGLLCCRCILYKLSYQGSPFGRWIFEHTASHPDANDVKVSPCSLLPAGPLLRFGDDAGKFRHAGWLLRWGWEGILMQKLLLEPCK